MNEEKECNKMINNAIDLEALKEKLLNNKIYCCDIVIQSGLFSKDDEQMFMEMGYQIKPLDNITETI